MKKVRNAILATTGTAGLAGLMFWVAVMSYDTPKYDETKMEDAKRQLELAETRYESAQRRAILTSSDTLAQDKQYLELKAKSDKILTQSTYSYLELVKKMEKLANDLREQHINKNKELINATDNMKAAQDRVAQLQCDSVRADSLAQVPMSVRFNSNWNKIRKNYHDTKIKQHTLQLQKLQNERH